MRWCEAGAAPVGGVAMFSRFKISPLWRKRISRLGKPLVLVLGWFPLLWTAFKLAHELHIVARVLAMVGPQVTQFLDHWGWLLGLAVLLSAIFLWPESETEKARQESASQDHALSNLRFYSLDLLRKFERLCRTYEAGGDVELARFEALGAAGRALKTGPDSLPESERWKYEHLLRSLLLDYHQSLSHSELSTLGAELWVTEPIQHALNMNQTAPPASKASEQPRPSLPESSR